jgi:hypothetical protein
MNLEQDVHNALDHAQDALDEHKRIRQAIAAAEAELAAARAELPTLRLEFARERVTAIVDSKAKRGSKGAAAVAAARQRVLELEDEIDGLKVALSDNEDLVLAAQRELSGRVEALRSDAAKKYCEAYRKAFSAFYDVLRDGFGLMQGLDIQLPALRAMQVYEDPMGLRMANLGGVSAQGDYHGPSASPEIVAVFSSLRQTLSAATIEAHRIQQRRQVAEMREQRESDEGRRSTLHNLPADVEVA